MGSRSTQIQIRVSPREKAALESFARQAGQSVSAYVRARTLPSAQLRFTDLVRALGDADEWRFALAELNDLLAGITPRELAELAPDDDLGRLSPYLQNYLAAMVEVAARRKGTTAPPWTREIAPLDDPRFATDLPGLRLHLLRSAPVAFKRRNIFVDASVGDRV